MAEATYSSLTSHSLPTRACDHRSPFQREANLSHEECYSNKRQRRNGQRTEIGWAESRMDIFKLRPWIIEGWKSEKLLDKCRLQLLLVTLPWHRSTLAGGTVKEMHTLASQKSFWIHLVERVITPIFFIALYRVTNAFMPLSPNWNVWLSYIQIWNKTLVPDEMKESYPSD